MFKTLTQYFLLSFLFFSQGNIFGQNTNSGNGTYISQAPDANGPGWELKKDDDGVKVWTRLMEGAEIKEIRMEYELESSLSAVVALLTDVPNMKNWIANSVHSECLKIISPTVYINYQHLESPWPVQDRDMVNRMTITQNPTTKVVSVDSKPELNFYAEKENIVRLVSLRSLYLLFPKPGGNIKVVYTTKFHPGGSIPPWIINPFIVSGPWKTTIRFKENLKNPKYHQMKIPFIQEL